MKNIHVLEIWKCLDKNAYLHPDLLEKQDESTKALLSSGAFIDSASSERTRSRFKQSKDLENLERGLYEWHLPYGVLVTLLHFQEDIHAL